MTINVYDSEDRVIKVAEAKKIDLRFGAVRAIMELLNIESIDNTSELLKTTYAAWDQLVVVLAQVFPDMEYSDWENVKLKELMPVIYEIVKYSFGEILKLPKDPKN